MTRFNFSKSILAILATATLASGMSGEASACGNSRYSCHQPRVIYTQPAPTATVITRTEVIAKVVVTAPVRQLPEVPQGSTMRIKVNFLGNEPGVVFLTAGRLTLQCTITEWTPNYVVFELPELGVLEATAVTLDVAKADGKIARSVDVRLTPTPDIEIIESMESVEVVPRAPRKVSSNQATIQTGGISVRTAE